MSLQKSFLHKTQNAPIKRGTLELIAPETHEFKQLIMGDELRLEDLAKKRQVLTNADGY